MSTQPNNIKQSLQVKVTNRTSGVDNRPNFATRYRLPELNNINIGQECRRQVDELVAQRTVMDATLKAGLIKNLLFQKWHYIPISQDQRRSDVWTKIMYTQNLTVGIKE